MELQGQEGYEALVEEGRAIITQRSKNARNEIILGYAELGELIYNDPLYKKYQQQDSFLARVFTDLKISSATGYACIKFYEKFCKQGEVSNVLEKFNDGITWRRIVNEHLPDKQDIKEPVPGCKHCELHCS